MYCMYKVLYTYHKLEAIIENWILVLVLHLGLQLLTTRKVRLGYSLETLSVSAENI
jgi:hypothetical protein